MILAIKFSWYTIEKKRSFKTKFYSLNTYIWFKILCLPVLRLRKSTLTPREIKTCRKKRYFSKRHLYMVKTIKESPNEMYVLVHCLWQGCMKYTQRLSQVTEFFVLIMSRHNGIYVYNRRFHITDFKEKDPLGKPQKINPTLMASSDGH